MKFYLLIHKCLMYVYWVVIKLGILTFKAVSTMKFKNSWSIFEIYKLYDFIWWLHPNVTDPNIVVLFLSRFYLVATEISPNKRFTHIRNVILSILRSRNHFHSIEFDLGSQNWQGYISNRCVYPLFKWDLCSDRVKID